MDSSETLPSDDPLYPFRIIPFPEKVIRQNTVQAGDGGYLLSLSHTPDSPLFFGALYYRPAFDPTSLYFAPWWSDFCLVSLVSPEIEEAFSESEGKDLLRFRQVVLRRMFCNGFPTWQNPPYAFVRAYIHKKGDTGSDLSWQTRGDEGYTGYSTIVCSRPLPLKARKRCLVFFARQVGGPSSPKTLQSLMDLVKPKTQWSGLFQSMSIEKSWSISSRDFCIAADKELQRVTESSSSIDSIGGIDVGVEWSSLFEGSDEIPSRLLHDFSRPKGPEEKDEHESDGKGDIKIHMIHLWVSHQDGKKTKELTIGEEEHFNALGTKFMWDLMLEDPTWIVVGERRDHLLRGMRRQTFRAIREAYCNKPKDPNLVVGDKYLPPAILKESPGVLTTMKTEDLFKWQEALNVYHEDFSELAVGTRMADYSEAVSDRVMKIDLDPKARAICGYFLYDALFNAISMKMWEGDRTTPQTRKIPVRKAVIFRSPIHNLTVMWDQMVTWASGIYPSHLSVSKEEAIERPLYAQFYVHWASRTGRKLYTPLQSRQSSSKEHIVFRFPNDFSPRYDLYLHSGLNLMLRGVPANVFSRRGTSHKEKCNKLPVYPSSIHHIPIDCPLPPKTSDLHATYSAMVPSIKAKLYATSATLLTGKGLTHTTPTYEGKVEKAPVVLDSSLIRVCATPIEPCYEKPKEPTHQKLKRVKHGSDRREMKALPAQTPIQGFQTLMEYPNLPSLIPLGDGDVLKNLLDKI